ncbi:MAG: cell division protein FtsZ, partial [Giesbergeria sp.]|nr:cell division protein FtsZ [Giesbergeria sp.]
MSTLQISLAIIGGLLLALIVAYNAWTTHRNTPRKALPPEAERKPEASPRQEPAMDAELAPVSVSAVHGLDHGPDPALHGVDLDDALELPVPPLGNHDRWGLLDPLIDAIAPIAPEHLVSGEA